MTNAGLPNATDVRPNMDTSQAVVALMPIIGIVSRPVNPQKKCEPPATMPTPQTQQPAQQQAFGAAVQFSGAQNMQPHSIPDAPVGNNAALPVQPATQSISYAPGGICESLPELLGSELNLRYLNFAVSNTNVAPVAASDLKRIERIKRISSTENLAANAEPLLELCKTCDQAQLNGVFTAFINVFLDQAKNLLDDQQSVEAKVLWFPTLLLLVDKAACDRAAPSPLNCIFMPFLRLCPVVLGCCPKGGLRPLQHVNAYTLMFLLMLTLVPRADHRAIFIQICDSQKHCVEELQRTAAPLDTREFAVQIMQFLQGVYKFVQLDGRYGREQLRACFNYNPYAGNVNAGGSRLADYAQRILEIVEDRQQYNFIYEDLRTNL